MRKSYFAKALILGAAMLLALACTKEGNQKKVAVLLPDASSLDRWATDKSNLETVMASYGFNTTFYIAPETEAGAAQQVEQLREAINAGAKCVVLTAIDYKKINESGLLDQHPDVKVVCHDRYILDNPRVAYISSANTREVGRMQAQFLLNHFHSCGEPVMSLEILAGPDTDINAKEYYEGAMDLLQEYIDSGKLQVVSNRTEYGQVSADSWMISDAKIEMQDRLTFYNEGDRPDMVLAAVDNQAQGVIEALGLAGITDMPVITGQDNTAMAQSNIKRHLQTMTIDKNLKDMAYNTGLIVNGLLSNSPVQASRKVSGIPVFYSPLTVMTVDSY